jgi:hypothetical protein
LRLSHITNNPNYHELAEKTLKAFATRIKEGPSGVPQMVVALIANMTAPKQIVLAGPPSPVMMREIHHHFLPFHTLLGLNTEEARQTLHKWNPAVAEMQPIDGATAAYVCENFTCQLPVSNVEQLSELLK